MLRPAHKSTLLCRITQNSSGNDLDVTLAVSVRVDLDAGDRMQVAGGHFRIASEAYVRIVV